MKDSSLQIRQSTTRLFDFAQGFQQCSCQLRQQQ
jgi:hypothetical protein